MDEVEHRIAIPIVDQLATIIDLLERQKRQIEAGPTCITPHCPNPRYTNAGNCHHHRYLG
ncbi:hypothetical protein LCGC14_1832170 [marine sediment metagenome]|uniref:Uncharacterized protein n=1 Tax=marine sediment metagenome TaxID=412755 RepID=A0A0F9IV93_9ZZZZ